MSTTSSITYAKYVSGEQDRIDYTPSSAVSAGDVVVQEDLIGYATQDIAASALGSLVTAGVVNLPTGGEVIAAGVIVYWDAINSEITATSTSNKRIGKLIAATGSGDTAADVLISQG